MRGVLAVALLLAGGSQTDVKRGQRLEAYMPASRGVPRLEALACRSLAAYMEWANGVEVNDPCGTEDLLREGRAVELPIGAPVLVLKVTEYPGGSPPPVAEVRVLEGRRKGDRLWLACWQLNPPEPSR